MNDTIIVGCYQKDKIFVCKLVRNPEGRWAWLICRHERQLRDTKTAFLLNIHVNQLLTTYGLCCISKVFVSLKCFLYCSSDSNAKWNAFLMLGSYCDALFSILLLTNWIRYFNALFMLFAATVFPFLERFVTTKPAIKYQYVETENLYCTSLQSCCATVKLSVFETDQLIFLWGIHC